MTTAKVRALIVEDDPSWQQILGEILTDAGLTIDIVDNLKAAIAELRATPHRLAVVDLSLCGDDYHNQDGLRVLDAVRRLDPGCVTVMLTGFATVELAVSALTEHGAFTCLRKETFNRAQFRELVSQALASAPAVRTATHSSDGALPSASRGGRDKAAVAVKTIEEKPPLGLALIVEDDAGWRSILSELLTDAGYRVRLCASFGEALGCLRREKYALAVVDLSLARSTEITADFRTRGDTVGKLERVLSIKWLPGPRTRKLAGKGESSNSIRGSPEQDLDGYRLLASTRDAGIPTVVVSGIATPANIERAYAEHAVFAFVEKQAFDRRAFLHTVEEARAAAATGSELDCLTRREREVLGLLTQGLTNKEMAEALFITTNTVKRHLKAIFKKLDVHTRSAAAAKAISGDLVIE